MYFNSFQNLTDNLKNSSSIQSFPINKELKTLLSLRGALQAQLFEKARRVRHLSGMDFCLLRGVIEVTNYCQKNCSYCAMRASSGSRPNCMLNMAADLLEVPEPISPISSTTTSVMPIFARW